ncbi:MAG: hypothetical protein Q8K01_15750, partial [Sulfurimicrobium sp.]|nr:hypothetical protein [Sulfurimicrobium sp.]
ACFFSDDIATGCFRPARRCSVWPHLCPSEPDGKWLPSVPMLDLHLHGKRNARMGRMMSYFPVLGEMTEKVCKTALAARAVIGICDE